VAPDILITAGHCLVDVAQNENDFQGINLQYLKEAWCSEVAGYSL
jgi:hypothetical protein